MGAIPKLLVALVLVAVVGLGLFALYVAIALGVVEIPGLSAFVAGAAPAAPPPVNEAAVRQVEQKINEAGKAEWFTLELSEAELNLLLQRYVQGPAARLENTHVTLGEGSVSFAGEIIGRVPVPFGGSASVHVADGQAQLELQRVSVGAFQLPGAAQGLIAPVLNQVANLNQALGQDTSTVVLEKISITSQKVTVAGERRPQVQVQPSLVAGGKKVAAPALSRPVPEGRVASAPGEQVVVALGDSLAAAVGATRPELGYVARFHRYLEEKTGAPLGLQNFGISGETSGTLVSGGQLGRAVALLEQLKADGKPQTKATVILLNIGANDVNRVLVSSECQQKPQGATCQGRIQEALGRFRERFPTILQRLREAADPDTPVLILNYYNPFNLGTGLPFEVISEKTVQQLNAILAEVGRAQGARVADAHRMIGDNAGSLTHILSADIHPTDQGYAYLTAALMEAWEQSPR